MIDKKYDKKKANHPPSRCHLRNNPRIGAFSWRGERTKNAIIRGWFTATIQMGWGGLKNVIFVVKNRFSGIVIVCFVVDIGDVWW